MLVSDVQRLLALTQHLTAAASSQDWERVGQLDRMVSDLAANLPKHVSVEAQSAWRQLAVVHSQVRQACELALQEISARLRDLQNQSEAHKAYAWQEQFL